MPKTNLEELKDDNRDRQPWLREVLRPAKQGFREAIVVSLFINILALAVPIFILQVYDRVVFHQGISTLYALLMGVFIALIFDFLLRQARSRLLQRVALQIDISLGKSLFSRIASLPLSHLENRPTGFWQILFKDAELIRNTFSGSTAVLLTDLPFAFLFIGLIAIIAPPVLWVVVIAVPIFVLVAIISGIMIDNATRKERASGLNREAFIAEVIQGRTTIRALGIDNALKPNWEEKHAASISQASSRGRRMDGFANLGTMLSMLTTVALVTTGALAIIDLQMTIGALIASTMLGNRILAPLNQLVGSWRSYVGVIQAIKRLQSVFDLPQELEEASITLPRPSGSITLEQITFSYIENTPPTINGINLRVKAPCLVGIVGKNGSGKTTLLKLMQGLYRPNNGRILIDGADINQFGRTDMSRLIGYVPQECFLFTGSIRENIALALPEAKDEDILKAASVAGVHDYIIDLPNGYDTQIGEGGSRLSGGQKQRIAIARALIRNPSILLLDEVAANLDIEAQEKLSKTLINLAKNRTIIIVTHTPVLLKSCTSIVALDKGKVSMAGPSTEVLSRLLHSEQSKSLTSSKDELKSTAENKVREIPPQNNTEGD